MPARYARPDPCQDDSSDGSRARVGIKLGVRPGTATPRCTTKCYAPALRGAALLDLVSLMLPFSVFTLITLKGVRRYAELVMGESMPLTGGCFCGRVRYQIAAPLKAGRSCHCSRCRKAFSGAGSAYAEIEPG